MRNLSGFGRKRLRIEHYPGHRGSNRPGLRIFSRNDNDRSFTAGLFLSDRAGSWLEGRANELPRLSSWLEGRANDLPRLSGWLEGRANDCPVRRTDTFGVGRRSNRGQDDSTGKK